MPAGNRELHTQVQGGNLPGDLVQDTGLVSQGVTFTRIEAPSAVDVHLGATADAPVVPPIGSATNAKLAAPSVTEASVCDITTTTKATSTHAAAPRAVDSPSLTVAPKSVDALGGDMDTGNARGSTTGRDGGSALSLKLYCVHARRPRMPRTAGTLFAWPS